MTYIYNLYIYVVMITIMTMMIYALLPQRWLPSHEICVRHLLRVKVHGRPRPASSAVPAKSLHSKSMMYICLLNLYYIYSYYMPLSELHGKPRCFKVVQGLPKRTQKDQKAWQRKGKRRNCHTAAG